MALCAYQSNSTTWRTTQVSPDSCTEDWRIVTTQEYQEYMTLKGQVIAPVEPFDPVVAGGFFAVAFAGVLGTWILSQNIGLILEAVRKW
jgi:hypothetical protein